MKRRKSQPVSYRPFDYRYTYYTGNSRGFICMPRSEVMRHLVEHENMALCFIRRSRTQNPASFFVAETLVDKTILSSADNANVAPLYLYPDPNGLEYELSASPGGRRPNLAPEFTEELAKRLKLTFIPDGEGDLAQSVGPEDVFHYIYAVFHAPSYRIRYAEFLALDFPKVPFISSLPLFKTLVTKGSTLVELHLMRQMGASPASYPLGGTDRVDKPYYEPPEDGKPGRVIINSSQHFEGVPPEVWGFQVGGYQVCEKWLKDRRGLELSYDDIQHYQRIILALSETLNIMEEIDEVVAAHGGWPLIC